jgi:putative transposase
MHRSEWTVGHRIADGPLSHNPSRSVEPLRDQSDDYARSCWGFVDSDFEQEPVSWRGFHLASYWFSHPDHTDVEAFLAWFPITIGGTPIADPYPSWHANTIPDSSI